MNIKHSALVLSTLTFISLATPVFAINATIAPTKAAARQAKLDARSTNLKTRGDSEIDRRITALNNLLTRLGAIKRLTETQKANLSSQVQSEISALTELKAKINADTDNETLKTDVKSIVSNYRIFALFMPQMSIVINGDKILTYVEESAVLTGKLQSRINDAKAAGKDVTIAQAALDERIVKLADASTQAQAAITAVLSLTPSGYPDNLTTLKSARDRLKVAREDLKVAHKAALTIRQNIK